MDRVYQFGRFGSRRISAWTLTAAAGFTFETAPLKRYLGRRADITSRDDDHDDTLGTCNALDPKQLYFSEANLATTANIMDLHPSLELQLREYLTLGIGAIFQWRPRREDAIYLANLTQVEGTAGDSAQTLAPKWWPASNAGYTPADTTHPLRALRARQRGLSGRRS